MALLSFSSRSSLTTVRVPHGASRAIQDDGPAPATPIGAVRRRERVRLVGTVASKTFSPASASTLLTARLSDPSGSIELRWPGRRDIPGLHVGSRVEIQGVVGADHEKNIVINPLYRLISAERS